MVEIAVKYPSMGHIGTTLFIWMLEFLFETKEEIKKDGIRGTR